MPAPSARTACSRLIGATGSAPPNCAPFRPPRAAGRARADWPASASSWPAAASSISKAWRRSGNEEPVVAGRSLVYPAPMLKLIIGNKAYSSWSLRGWLAAKQSGLPFEEMVVPLYDADWDRRREGDEFAPSSGKVPILWDGDVVVWDSLAIVDFLNDKTGSTKFWPSAEAARAKA